MDDKNQDILAGPILTPSKNQDTRESERGENAKSIIDSVTVHPSQEISFGKEPVLKSISSQDLTPEARALAEAYIDRFISSLLVSAKLEASRKRNEKISLIDIETARESIDYRKGRRFASEFLMIFSGALFGIFIGEFMNYLTDGTEPSLLIFTIGLISIFLITLSLKRD